jgi:hypothetical protein
VQEIALDTEGSKEKPWGLSWAVKREGFVIAGVIRAKEEDSLTALRDSLQRFRCRVLLHHALHDLPVLRALGVEAAGYVLDDTMARAYHRQVEPQALKDLALRHLGVVGPEYMDLVRPVWEERVRELAESELAQETYHVLRSPKTGRLLKKTRLYRTERGKMLARRMGNAKRLAELLESPPEMGLDLLSPERATRYSVEDAVMTLLLGERL